MTGQNRRLRRALFVLAVLWAASPASAVLAGHQDDDWGADAETCGGLDWRSTLIDEDVPIVTRCLPDQAGFAPASAEDGSAAEQLRI